MTAPARQPEPSIDASDAVLDLWEAATRAALSIGGEAAIRARLARLMPEAKPAHEPLDGMALAAILTALRAGDNRRWSDGEHAARAQAKSLALAALENIKRRA